MPTLLNQARSRILVIAALCGGMWATGCGNSVGDGVTDDGTSTPPLSSGGRTSGSAGSKSHAAGASSHAAGAGAVGGSSGSGGSGGSHAGAGGGGGKAAGGSSGTGGSAGPMGGGGSGGALAYCGNGVVEPGEGCDDPGGLPTTSCSPTCNLVADTDCLACEMSGTCVDFFKNCFGPVGGPNNTPTFTSIEENVCYAVMTCIETSNCFDDAGTLGGSCYCGSLSIADCQKAPFTGAGGPNGPCAAVIQAGLPGITSNSGVLGNLTKNSLPAGAGMQRLNCQKTADEKACAKACGFSSSL